MMLLFRLELFLYLVYVPTISFMITPKVVYFLHQSLAVGNILIVEVLRSNYDYHYVYDVNNIVIYVGGYVVFGNGTGIFIVNHVHDGSFIDRGSRLSKN